MFQLTLRLKSANFHGFPALDFRRRHGLEDGDFVYTDGYTHPRSYDVGEAFSRAWFAPATAGEASIDVAWLIPGELARKGPDTSTVVLAENISPERAKELYVRARFEALSREKG